MDDIMEIIKLINKIGKIKYRVKIDEKNKKLIISFEDFNELKEIIEKLI